MERQNGGRRGTGGAVVGEMIGAGSERRWRWWLKWNVWWLTEAFGWANDTTSWRLLDKNINQELKTKTFTHKGHSLATI